MAIDRIPIYFEAMATLFQDQRTIVWKFQPT